MRSHLCLFLVLMFASPLAAQTAQDSSDTAAEFQLGGSVTHAVIAPPVLPGTRQRLSVPRLIRETSQTIQRTAFGGISLYFGESWDNNQDVFQFGTALTRGQTTAGVAVTYEDRSRALTSSELFLDYAVTDRLSVGISGIYSEDLTSDDDPVPQLGLNAALNTGNGTFLRGGIADSRESDPVFGVAIGLRF